MRKAKLVKVYAVMLVSGETMKELFRSTDKELCKEFKKENSKKGSWVLCMQIIFGNNGKEKTRCKPTKKV